MTKAQAQQLVQEYEDGNIELDELFNKLDVSGAQTKVLSKHWDAVHEVEQNTIEYLLNTFE